MTANKQVKKAKKTVKKHPPAGKSETAKSTTASRAMPPEQKEVLAELREQKRFIVRAAKALGLEPDAAMAEVIQSIIMMRIFGLTTEKRRAPSSIVPLLQKALKLPIAEVTKGTSKAPADDKKKKDLGQHLEQIYGPGVVVVDGGADA